MKTLANKYHFVGIGGIGMSGLARLLLERNISVSGTDLAKSELVDNLKTMGAQIDIGHDKKHVPKNASLVVTSMIAKNTNPEVQFAEVSNLPILHRSDLLHLLMQGFKPLLVAGTHGKTTTTSLLASVLLKADLKPSYAIGGVLVESGTNAGHGIGEYFVAEADESDGTFLKYHPFGAIITNIDNDHMEHFGDEEALCKAFQKFAEGVKSKDFLFYCGDDVRLRALQIEGISYGFNLSCQLKGSQFRQKGRKIYFDVEFEGKKYLNLEVAAVGYHNALNALAVFGMSLKLGIGEQHIREAFRLFKGIKRRAEVIGEKHHVLILDDYGHHPTEIETTLKGIKAAFPYRRVVALFQPHRYTRTRDCLKQFGTCFESADEVLVTEIYGANEEPIPGVNASQIIDEIRKASKMPVEYVLKEKLIDHVISNASPFDVYVTLGAGDITKEGPKLLQRLEEKAPSKIKCGVIFGGKSSEHEISILSIQNIVKGLDPKEYEVSYFYISKSGAWVTGEPALKILQSKKPSEIHNPFSPEILKALQNCDIVFPVLHGPNGEDGTVQGLFDILGIPHVGCSLESSAVTMDKSITKKLVQNAGLAVADYIDFSFYDWTSDRHSMLQKIQMKLQFPLIVKPVHLGSTMGVKKVETANELISAIDDVFKLDGNVLVEAFIKGRELEFSVFGDGAISVFPPGEIMTQGKIYDYQGKYFNSDFPTTPSAKLDLSIIEKGMAFASKAYLAAGCDGYARVDCFLDENDQFFLNEINTIPGFTGTSLFPQMCETGGLKLIDLINELVCISLQRARFKRRHSDEFGHGPETVHEHGS